jgi:aminopeptidase-like protein
MHMHKEADIGIEMYGWAKDLYPICRSITGAGLRQTLAYLRNLLPGLQIQEVASGTQVFDWTVPDEWTIRDAFIADEAGNRIVDFQRQNLHLVGYSGPVDKTMSLDELQDHLHSLPAQPDAIPYITSYYAPRWGFSLSHNERMKLKPGNYRVYIDSTIAPGTLTYGELIIPGATKKEVFLSTYICHPSMANNELSGPCVTTCIARWLTDLRDRRYTYRIVFIPETIGSITYLSRNLKHLKSHVIAGFNITCVGDDRTYSFVPSRNGHTLSDRAALHVLKYLAPSFKHYSYLDRGSDERQYCSPGVDLPIATIMRSKYREYPEYHTSLDDLTLISPQGLAGGFEAIRKAIEIIENNAVPQVMVFGEPQLGKRGLYPTLGTKSQGDIVRMMMDMLAYCDGKNTLLDIAEILGREMGELIPIYRSLNAHGLVVDLQGLEKNVF